MENEPHDPEQHGHEPHGQQSPAHLDEATLRELRLVLGDNFAVLVSTWLGDGETRLAAMRVAVAAADGEALRRAAHALKGSSLNLGAHRLAAFCQSLETCVAGGDLTGAPALLDAIAAEWRRVSALLAG